MFRTPRLFIPAPFRRSHHLADGPPAQPARAEGQGAVEAVIEFRPRGKLDQLPDAGTVHGRTGAGEQLADILRAAGEEMARGNRGVRLELTDGSKLLIGSQKPELLAAAIDGSLRTNT